MNNKGFAVSAVLYTLLIAFLLFLAAALAMFSSSNSLISNANSDIVNGNPFSASIVNIQTSNKKTYKINSGVWGENRSVRIKSRYGIKYWPNDFAFNNEGYSWEQKTANNNDVFKDGYLIVTYDSGKLNIKDDFTGESISVNLP